MTVPANTMGGAEIKTFRKKDYHFGLYECRMKCSNTPGVVQAFFWQADGGNNSGEIDIEFLTKEFGSGTGKVHFTTHPKPANQGHFDPRHQQIIDLDFNPADAFHVYGFHWTEQVLTCYVDGDSVCVFNKSEGAVIPNVPGLIWLNTWTGNPNFGGGPPTADATQIFDWVKFWPESGTGIQDPIVMDY
jgi:beta-glucanase (GH16 family)